MKNIRLATVVLIGGLWSGGLAAAHDHSQHGDQPVVPAAAAAEDPGAMKTIKVKGGDKAKEKSVKAALQKHSCLLCHKYKGKGGTTGPALDEHLRHHPKEELKKLLKEPKKPMPPFPGTEKELDEFLNTVVPASAGSAASKPAVKRTAKTYVCPMGEYESGKPGKCPKCGMTLVEKK